MKVCLLGATFETGNMGVSALTAGIIESIIHNDPNAEIILLDSGKEKISYKFKTIDHEISIRLVNMRFSKKIYLSNHIAMLILQSLLFRMIPSRIVRERLISGNQILNYTCSCDYVASINGGDSFSDIYGLKRFFFVVLPQFLILFLKRPLILLPQTIGPFEGKMTRFLAGYILENASTIYSRDYTGLNEARELMREKYKSPKLKFCHDVGFVIQSLKPPNMDLDGLLESLERNNDVTGLNVSGLLFVGGYTGQNMFGLKSDYKELIYELIDLLINKKQLTVLLVPHVFGFKDPECDNLVCEKIYSELKTKYKERLFLARGHYNQNEIKYIIGMCNFFIGSRMHACIAALSQCIPAVGIAYSKKFKGVFETVDLQHLVADPRILNKKEIFEIINHSIEDRKNISTMLQKLMPEVRQEILNLFKNIV